VDNLGAGTTVEFSLNTLDSFPRGGAGPCQVNCQINRYANAAGVALLNLGDNTQSDVAQLADNSTYSVDIFVTGGVASPGFTLGTLGAQPNILPAGYLVTEFNVSPVGKTMTQINGVNNPIAAKLAQFGAAGSQIVTPQNTTTGSYYLPLVFKNYNCSAADLAATQANGTPCGWNSGISLTNAQTNLIGSGTVAWTIALYDRGGQFLGNYSATISAGNQFRTLYLPSVPWLPDGFSGTAIVNGQTNGDVFGIFGSLMVTAHSVNYGRNQAIATNAITSTTVADRTDDVGALPCTSNGFASCLFFTKFAKGANSTNSRSPFETSSTPGSGTGIVASGENVGIRIFNPDVPTQEAVISIPGLTPGAITGIPASGNPASVTVQYTDDAGLAWPTATDIIVVPSLGTATLFPLDNFNIPQLFSGTAYVQSTGNFITAVANDVNYSITDHDVSGAYLGQYSNGHLQ
jgi:hypothetical protein